MDVNAIEVTGLVATVLVLALWLLDSRGGRRRRGAK